MSMIEAAERDGKMRQGHRHHRADLRQHRHRPGVRLRRQGLPAGHHHAGELSLERRRLLKAFGAEFPSLTPRAPVSRGPAAGPPTPPRVRRRGPGVHPAGQFAEPGQPGGPPQDHRAEEVWKATSAAGSDIFVSGVGTGGTITGTARPKEQRADIQIIGADPVRSIFSNKEVHPYLVEGVGEDFGRRRSTRRSSTTSRCPDRDSFYDPAALALEVGAAGGRLVRPCRPRRARGRRHRRPRGDDRLVPRFPTAAWVYRARSSTTRGSSQYGFLSVLQPYRTVGDVQRDKTTAGDLLFVTVQTHQKVKDAISLLGMSTASQLPVVSGSEPPRSSAGWGAGPGQNGPSRTRS